MTMKITLYKSSLCPRCYFAKKALEECTRSQADVELEYVDIISSPKRVVQDGIKMIPAIKVGNRVLSGIFLTKAQIATFFAEET